MTWLKHIQGVPEKLCFKVHWGVNWRVKGNGLDPSQLIKHALGPKENPAHLAYFPSPSSCILKQSFFRGHPVITFWLYNPFESECNFVGYGWKFQFFQCCQNLFGNFKWQIRLGHRITFWLNNSFQSKCNLLRHWWYFAKSWLSYNWTSFSAIGKCMLPICPVITCYSLIKRTAV